MTIVDKASESSDPSAYQNQPGSSEAVSPGDMDAGSASWGAVSSLNDVSNHTLSLGPVPGAVVYSSSSVPDKSKPSPQKDQGTTFKRQNHSKKLLYKRCQRLVVLEGVVFCEDLLPPQWPAVTLFDRLHFPVLLVHD